MDYSNQVIACYLIATILLVSLFFVSFKNYKKEKNAAKSKK